MNLIIFGPQGSGKGTQADLLSAKLGLVHIETGEIFRQIAREESALGTAIRQLNEGKEMIPDPITVSVLEAYVSKLEANQGVILDSAPRTSGQIEPVENMLAGYGRSIDRAIYISLPYDESVARITKRYACTLCYRHLIRGKDILSGNDACPTCGGPVRQRGDDTPDGIVKRLATFYALTIPVIEHYRSKGLLVEVDGNRTVEEVFADIVQQLA